MYLLTKSETLTANISVSLSDVTDAGTIIDGKLDTFVESATLAPIRVIDDYSFNNYTNTTAYRYYQLSQQSHRLTLNTFFLKPPKAG